jgi:exonuclease III
MGIYRGSVDVLNLMKKRMEILRKDILELKPDILCFQEMSTTSFNELYTKELSDVYKYYYEQDIQNPDLIKDRNKDIEVFVISKYPIKQVTIYQLEGNLEYSNSLGVYEFGNLIVINSYLQAGSKKSPGQTHKAKHYSRCRSQELMFINSLIDGIPNSDKLPVILLGDFNFDLNGSIEEWPEIEHLHNLKFKDSWIDANPTLDINKGNTEETDINNMRWNNKLEEKHFRYDAILYKKLKSLESKVIFNKPYLIDSKKLSDSYENSIIPKGKIDDSRIKKVDGKYELFISDHFGVFTKFRFE